MRAVLLEPGIAEGTVNALLRLSILHRPAPVTRRIACLLDETFEFISSNLELTHGEAAGNLHRMRWTFAGRSIALVLRGSQRVFPLRHDHHLRTAGALPEADILGEPHLERIRQGSVFRYIELRLMGRTAVLLRWDMARVEIELLDQRRRDPGHLLAVGSLINPDLQVIENVLGIGA